MKLPFRLISTLTRAHLRAPIDLQDDVRTPSVTTWRVLPTDLDLFGHMNNGRYAMIMDLARVDFLVRTGLMPTVLAHRWTVPVGSTNIEFRGSLRPFQAYEVHTSLAYWDDRWFYMRQEFRCARDPSRLLAVGWVRALFRSRNASIAPDEVLRAAGVTLTRPALTSEVSRRFGLGEARSSEVNDKGSVVQRGVTNGCVEAPSRGAARDPIAIVGIGCRLPGGVESPADLWSFLANGGDAIVDIPASRWDGRRYHDPSGKAPGRSYVHRAGILQHDLEAFDAAFFGITPREAATLDPQQRLLLETSWEAFEDARVAPPALAGSRTGVFVGGFMMDNHVIFSRPQNRHLIATHSGTASTMTMLSNRLSYVYDLRGPSLTIDTACSSSLVALHLACRSIWSGESEAALCGGVNAILVPETHVTMAKGQFLSPRGRCHAFAEGGDGYVRAEGAALLVLKPLSAALRDGNPIYALIRGTACNQDGRTNGISLPSREAQVSVLRAAYADAGVDPQEVAYVEAHGTGTAVGDPIEAHALAEVVGDRNRPCAIGSIKTNLGHLEAGAGVAGVIKAALCLKYGSVPPHLHLDAVNPGIDLEALGLVIPTESTPLPRRGSTRYAGVNAFGYGGTNAHIVLEQAPPQVDSAWTTASQRAPERPLLLPVSARSPEAQSELLAAYAERVRDAGSRLPELCSAAATGRAHHRLRAAAWGRDARELERGLLALQQGNRRCELGVQAQADPGAGLVFVFTGMGPQSPGMGSELLAREPVFAEAVAECDAIFRRLCGWSIADELQASADRSRMARTEVAQPANVVLQIALTRLLASWGIRPAVVLGHSVGEVAAAHVCGALSLEDTMLVAYHRSRLQQRLAGAGGMLAVGVGFDEAEVLVRGAGARVSIAAVNAPRSVVLAGETGALAEIERALTVAGRFAKTLRVEVPYHSPAMDAIRAELVASLRSLAPQAPTIPVVSTVTGAMFGGSFDADYWWRNVREPVAFAAASEALLSEGHAMFLEVGPHPVLAGPLAELASASGRSLVSVASLRRDVPDPSSMIAAVASLYVHGIDPDWEALAGSPAATQLPLPRYPWQRKHHWNESETSIRMRRASAPHPMIDTVHEVPTPHCSSDVTPCALPWLSDHRVGGRVVFPGAALLELVHAAWALQHEAGACALEDVEWKAAVVLEDDEAHTLHVTFDDAAQTFAVHHVRDGERRTLYATGKWVGVGKPRPHAALESIERRCQPPSPPADLYAALARKGLVYGPRFQAVRSVRSGTGEVVAELELPPHVDASGYRAHPVLLDAGMHAMLACVDNDDDRELMPVEVERFVQYAPLPTRLLVHCQIVAVDGDGVRGSVRWCSEAGETLASMEGLRCRFLQRSAASQAAAVDRLFHAQKFVPVALDEPGEAALESVIVIAPEHPQHRAHVRSSPRVRVVGSDVELAAVLGGRSKSTVIDLRAAMVTQEALGVDEAAAFLDTLRILGRPSAVATYVVVTNGAIALEGECPSLGAAPLVGVARTAMTERPDLGILHIDVDADDPERALQRCLELLPRLRGERQVVVRDERVLAPRLVARPLPAAAPPAISTRPAAQVEAFELSLGQPGNIGSLAFEATTRHAPRPGEIVIEVDSVSLGFKDVMKALGLITERIRRNTYFGEAIGMEGTGVVVAVGEGVEGFENGDRVYGVAPGFLRSHVTMPAERALRLPDHLSFEDGANLIVYATVYHALVKIAGLQRGETVLIHGATGGVGLAAIDMARACGAQIIASAGTPEKRDYLRGLGIEHVTTSRDPSFADDVHAWTEGRGVDVVLNVSPGDIMRAGLRCLARFGRFVELGKMSFEHDEPLFLRPFNESLVYAAVDSDRLFAHRPAYVRDLYLDVFAMFRDGKLTPMVKTAFGASEVVDAFHFMARGKHIGQIVVRLRDERLRVTTSQARRRLRDDASYLVTGGTSGFGLAIAEQLGKLGARHLVLASRRGIPGAADDEVLARLRANGIDVQCIAADVSSRADVERLVAHIDGTGRPLAGIVHAAAVLDDRPTSQVDRDSLERVLAPKAQGALHLHELTLGRDLDHFVLCSSISAVLGNANQANYVAANVVLDTLATVRRHAGLPATSIQWGALGDTGMVARDAALAGHLRSLGLEPLPLPRALAAFERVLWAPASESPPVFVIADIDWQRLVGALDPQVHGRLFEELVQRTGSRDELLHERFAGLHSAARRELVQCELRTATASIMRVGPNELDVAVPLRSMGLDSIMAVELAAEADARLGLRLSPPDLAAGPSVEELTNVLLAQIERRVGPAVEGGVDERDVRASALPSATRASSRSETVPHRELVSPM